MSSLNVPYFKVYVERLDRKGQISDVPKTSYHVYLSHMVYSRPRTDGVSVGDRYGVSSPGSAEGPFSSQEEKVRVLPLNVLVRVCISLRF